VSNPSRWRAVPNVVRAALAAWALTLLALLLAPRALAKASNVARPAQRAIAHLARSTEAHTHLVAPWSTLVDLLIACAVVTSLLAVRALLRPAAAVVRDREQQLQAARAIVEEHGEDSLSPFILRADKSFQFAAGGVLAYRVFGSTAVVSGDPIGPRASAPEVLAQFLRSAHARGWHVALYGSSARHVDRYRRMGLRAVCVGEEAVVDPARFTLEGRPVRKLRQSVNRIERRGWEITACEGRQIDRALEAEIDALEAAWRTGRPRLLGFAMAMGEFECGVQPHDLYLLGRSPDGVLQASMRFISHRGKLSLDTMRRVGETPNGLNEALVCRALEIARERGVPEVSLNYAGLAHLVRNGPSGNAAMRAAKRLLLWVLGRHFQMQRLVRFNEKFAPEWRPRYLVYESRAALPRSVFRVLQAEGYLPQRARPRVASGKPAVARRLRDLATVERTADGRLGR
jgi:lysyl-tRNA synthetase class 2